MASSKPFYPDAISLFGASLSSLFPGSSWCLVLLPTLRRGDSVCEGAERRRKYQSICAKRLYWPLECEAPNMGFAGDQLTSWHCALRTRPTRCAPEHARSYRGRLKSSCGIASLTRQIVRVLWHTQRASDDRRPDLLTSVGLSSRDSRVTLECGGQRRDRTADAGLFRAALYH